MSQRSAWYHNGYGLVALAMTMFLVCAAPAAKPTGTPTATATILTCQVNIGSNHRQLQYGKPGGNGARWVMNGAQYYGVPNFLEYGVGSGKLGPAVFTGNPNGNSYYCMFDVFDYNYQNRDAQLQALKDAGGNCIRMFMNAQSAINTVVAHGLGRTEYLNRLVNLATSCKNKGLFIQFQNNAELIQLSSSDWDKYAFPFYLDLFKQLAAAGCTNVIMGAHNEPNGAMSDGDWQNGMENILTKWKAAGYTGPVILDMKSRHFSSCYSNVVSWAATNYYSGNVLIAEHSYLLADSNPVRDNCGTYPMIHNENGGGWDKNNWPAMNKRFKDDVITYGANGLSAFAWNNGQDSAGWLSEQPACTKLSTQGTQWRDNYLTPIYNKFGSRMYFNSGPPVGSVKDLSHIS
jgi:hypothetical protein